MPNRQRGAALIVVLALLASALMVGIMAGQAGLVAEHLGSNYRASVIAQMRAEVAALQALGQFKTLEWDAAPLVSDRRDVKWEEYTALSLATHINEGCPQSTCLFIPVKHKGQAWVMALGVVEMADKNRNTLLAQSSPVFVRLKKSETSEGGTKETAIWH